MIFENISIASGNGAVASSLLLIFAIGAAAQWLGWRLKVPAILLLLAGGFLAGPVFQVLHIDEVFGELLFPIVSGAVAIILFEGGLTLRFHELKGKAGAVIFRLVSVGVLVSWLVIAWLAHMVLGFPLLLAALLGALLTVTGPTVIGPMLRTIRPKGKVRSIAKWEGILIDPVGVVLAVLIFEVFLAGQVAEAPMLHMLVGAVKTLVIGVVFTGIAGGLVLLLVKRRMLPDYLQNTVVLALLLLAFGASNYLQEESGLVTATLFGIFLANQSIFEVRHIVEFKENLQILLISFLFVVLAARVEPEAVSLLGWQSAVFLIGVIVLARPMAVMISTAFSNLKWSERSLLMMLAPRGIVAVALTSVFVLKLDQIGVPQAQEFLALTLLVVVGTVVFYGLLAAPVATRLGLSNLDPQGVIFVGAHDWSIKLASALHDANVPVLMLDSNRMNIDRARKAGLLGEVGNVFADEFIHELDFSNMGHALALTANDEVNAFARSALSHSLERADTYHLVATKQDNPQGGKRRRMNPLFAEGATFRYFQNAFINGAKVRMAVIDEGSGMDSIRPAKDAHPIPLFCIEPDGTVQIFSAKTEIKPKPGATIIYLETSALPPAPQKETNPPMKNA
ncbi:cation:proton antiporter [Rubellicoccus peritrichatus]|uniref:Cation:proton antiporter n=1 Tax=Rubellicoccus peritrichatus TaxID=3080537 RepID=A0AAQ3QQ83_9BACT|nr:cation:proton antiporter [Puniceicoccus sp. CR14]WOO39968.1 cation:proton antiporter [Puniceicoccus sp. CR14]